MKPFYCTDLTLDKNNKEQNGKEFITATLPQDVLDDFNKKSDEHFKKFKKLHMFLPILIKGLCLYAGLMLSVPLLIRGFRVGFGEMLAQNSLLFIIGISCLLIAAITYLIEIKIKKSVLNGKTEEEFEAEDDKYLQDVYNALGVPSYATETEIFSFTYKESDGVTPQDDFFNDSFVAYEDGDSLHFSDSLSVYSFKKNDLVGIRRVNQIVPIAWWHKDGEPTDEKYAKYITPSKKHIHGTIDRYYILEVIHNGETFGIYFPSYELPTFEKLTGLFAEG